MARCFGIEQQPGVAQRRLRADNYVRFERRTRRRITSEPNEVTALFAIANSPNIPEAERTAARDALVDAHFGLVEMAAYRYRDRGEPVEDLIQVGSIGLLKAIKRFDPERGVKFSAFAVPTITGEIKRHFRDLGWSVRVPRRLRELVVRLRPAREELRQQLGREPSAAELAEALGIPQEEVVEALDSAQAYATMSLETPRNSDGSLSLAETMGDDDDDLARVLTRESLRPALEALESRQRRIVVMRFFGQHTQAEIGEELGISQVQVSRILTRTLSQMRMQMAS